MWYLNNFEKLVLIYALPFIYFVLELSKLNNLEQLKLDDSSIDKSLLHKIGVMTSLNVLTVRGCGMNGTLPDQGRVLTKVNFCYDFS